MLFRSIPYFFDEMFDSLTAQSGPRVLHDISFEIKSGERIGIGKDFSRPGWDQFLIDQLLVGRTGSGKVSAFKIDKKQTGLMIYTEFFDAGVVEMHFYRRKSLLRRHCNGQYQP